MCHVPVTNRMSKDFNLMLYFKSFMIQNSLKRATVGSSCFREKSGTKFTLKVDKINL